MKKQPVHFHLGFHLCFERGRAIISQINTNIYSVPSIFVYWLTRTKVITRKPFRLPTDDDIDRPSFKSHKNQMGKMSFKTPLVLRKIRQSFKSSTICNVLNNILFYHPLHVNAVFNRFICLTIQSLHIVDVVYCQILLWHINKNLRFFCLLNLP